MLALANTLDEDATPSAELPRASPELPQISYMGDFAISALQTVSLPNMRLLRPIYQSNLPKELLYGKTKERYACNLPNMQFYAILIIIS